MGSEAPITPRWGAEQAYACLVVMAGVGVLSFTVGAASSIIADMSSDELQQKQEQRREAGAVARVGAPGCARRCCRR